MYIFFNVDNGRTNKNKNKNNKFKKKSDMAHNII